MSAPPVLHELLDRAHDAGMRIGGSRDGIQIWTHEELGGTRYCIEWAYGREQLGSPVGDETEWQRFQRPYVPWQKVPGSS